MEAYAVDLQNKSKESQESGHPKSVKKMFAALYAGDLIHLKSLVAKWTDEGDESWADFEDAWGNNLLHCCCASNCNGRGVQVLEFLIGTGLFDINSKNGDGGRTPLMLAAWSGHGEVCEELCWRKNYQKN